MAAVHSDQPSPSGSIDPPTRSEKPRRIAGGTILALTGVFLACLAAAGIAYAKTGSSSSDEYLGALKRQGLLSAFAGNKVAVTTGHKVCGDIDNGANDQGTAVQKVAVQYFCPSYLPKFHVLRHGSVSGTFTITNGTYDPTNEYENPNYSNSGGTCDGQSGYSDLNSTTQVTVTDTHGAELARTELGIGAVDTSADACVFTFNFGVTEGADQYIVTIGHRGSSDYTFDALSMPDAIALTIGSG